LRFAASQLVMSSEYRTGLPSRSPCTQIGQEHFLYLRE
jgi:hypothetical protein